MDVRLSINLWNDYQQQHNKTLINLEKNLTTMDKNAAKAELRVLVDRFNQILKKEGDIKSKEEEKTKKDLIRPLFERVLGWNFEEDVTAEEKISKGWVDYGLRINGIPKFFLEAKALREDLDNPNFFQQAVNYAWYKGCTWAVLTNFETVKILNAEWEAPNYLHSHFMTIKCDEFLDRFDDLWLLSKESFEQGLLDKLAEKFGKRTKKTTVDKQLLNDFTRFRDVLSKNIAKLNQKRKLTEEELDESIQRILNRLVFIRNCEDRGLEEKKLWEAKNEARVWKKVKEVFAYYDKNYDSKLFTYDLKDSKKVHLCDTLDIDDGVMREIVDGLYRTKDRSISYDFSIIDADVLGTVYEQYLSHILKKTEKRAKLTENQMHRKEHGIYYTPVYIVDYIVRSTLGELLKDKKVDVEKIRVLDPACGSGSFLIKAYDVFSEYYRKNDKDYNQTQLDFKTGTPFARKVKILQNNIFGVDLDKQAVEIAQLNLLLKLAEKGHRLPLLEQNIKCGNSLIDDEKVAGDKAFKWNDEFGEIMKEGGFNVVIGNPPYIDSEEMVRTQPELREAYTNIYSTARGNWDIFCIFLEKGLRLLRDGGFLGMIIPNKLLSANYALEIRKFIQNYTIVAIRDYSRIAVFQASVYPIVIIIKKESPKRNKFRAELMESYADGVRVSSFREIEQQKDLQTPQNTWAHIFGESGKRIMDKILANSELLENVGEVSGAASVSEAYELKSIIKELSSQSSYFRFVNTGTIDRYSSLWGVFKTTYIKTSYYKPVVSKEDLRKFSDKRYEQAQETKIIIAGMTKRLECYLDEGHCLAGKSTTIVLPRRINPKVLLAILNSKLLTFIYKNLFKSLSLAGGFMRVGPPQIKKLPIKIVLDTDEQAMIKLVDKMLSLNKRLNEIYDKRTDEHVKIDEEIKKTDSEIDELVYKIYGITESEKKIIEMA